MEQTENIHSEAATGAPALPAARVSDRLTPSLIEPALDAGRDSRPGRAQRADGWTPERVRTFLITLADCGVVADAARAAGMSAKSAYNLRNRTGSRAFHVAWAAAEQLARRRLSSDVLSRAIHGSVEVVIRDGKVWGERHRFDNRLAMAVLTRLDRQAAAIDRENRAVRTVAQEFDQFLDILCADGKGAGDFVADRTRDPVRGEEDLLDRAENYRLYGVGLSSEIPDADLDPRERSGETEEQVERARGCGLIDDETEQ